MGTHRNIAVALLLSVKVVQTRLRTGKRPTVPVQALPCAGRFFPIGIYECRTFRLSELQAPWWHSPWTFEGL